MHSSDEVLSEWFSDPARWWNADPEFDQFLRQEFKVDVDAAIRGELDKWAEAPRGALALRTDRGL